MEHKKDLLVENKTFYNTAHNFLKIFGNITKTLFILLFIGILQPIGSTNLNYIESFFFYVSFYVKILIALFLMYRFNDWRVHKIKFTELDRKVCYSAGTFIILFSFYDFINRYINELQQILHPYFYSIFSVIPLYKNDDTPPHKISL